MIQSITLMTQGTFTPLVASMSLSPLSTDELLTSTVSICPDLKRDGSMESHSVFLSINVYTPMYGFNEQIPSYSVYTTSLIIYTIIHRPTLDQING